MTNHTINSNMHCSTGKKTWRCFQQHGRKTFLEVKRCHTSCSKCVGASECVTHLFSFVFLVKYQIVPDLTL
jgi:hypothetical protein